MTSIRPAGLAGLGCYVPEKRLTNADLEKMVDTSDAWIVQRTGIRERRIAREDESASDMATIAAQRALEDAGVDAADLDLIMCATVTGDQPFPASAGAVAENLGADKAAGWDIAAACSGWVVGAHTAKQFINTGAYDRILVVGVEKLSSIVNYQDRGTCILFGDGAGAGVFTSLEEAGQGEFLSSSAGLKGGVESVEALSQPAGGSRIPATQATVENGLHYVHMEGRAIYRFAVKTFARLVREALEPYDRDELGLLVPHQVNLRIIESAAEQVGIPMDQILVNIHNYGNTSSASVPIALTEARDAGRFEKGKLICTVAFGAGLTWGHGLFRW